MRESRKRLPSQRAPGGKRDGGYVAMFVLFVLGIPKKKKEKKTWRNWMKMTSST